MCRCLRCEVANEVADQTGRQVKLVKLKDISCIFRYIGYMVLTPFQTAVGDSRSHHFASLYFVEPLHGIQFVLGRYGSAS